MSNIKDRLANKLVVPFKDAKEFEDFLDREHQSLDEVYVKLAKKATGLPSITAPEAVEVALCFGWIDGQGCGIDESWWTTRFVPRRPKSLWSKKNVDTVGRLIEQGLMRPAGLAAVEAAKADGRWDRAYAGPATITEPDDFKLALAANAVAKKVFGTLNKTERYSVLWKIETASPTARPKRIETLIQMLAEGKKPPRPGTKAASSTSEDGVAIAVAVADKSTKSTAGKVVKSSKRNVKAQAKTVTKTTSTATSAKKDKKVAREPLRSGLRARS